MGTRRHVPRFLRRALVRIRFGDLQRLEPLSPWGEERGTPVDRRYIEAFLAEHSHLITGHALEVKSDAYASRFGAASVDVLDIDPTNLDATVLGDVCDPVTLPAGTYDVAVVTQTLQLVAEPLLAVRHLLSSLRPGGSLLLTVPTMSRVVNESDRWRWTPSGLHHLLMQAAPAGAAVEVLGMGNGLAARAFLFGLAVQDLDEDVLVAADRNYPLVVGGVVKLTP